ncbi:hypothetical protein C0J50_11745, partial [Silurus asotus]
FISSRLDYWNALYLGITQFSLHHLQLVQNAAARLLTGTSKCAHITPVLSSLHWPPVQYRIQYKILLYVLSSNHVEQDINHGETVLSVAPPKLWNSLPPDLTSEREFSTFKAKLKTHLFTKVF